MPKNIASKTKLITFLQSHGLALLLLCVVGFQTYQNQQTKANDSVLGYATNISINDLLAITNQNRAGSGLSALAISPKLNTAAQNKAQHMIDNDYWAHYAPDGTSPWFFINQTGYAYQKAGENLAYGFSTSSGVMNGWMNSPGHAANVLDAAYREVGFGFRDGANFQGGENTVVVAMYALPAGYQEPTPEPEPEPVAPAPDPPAPQTTAPSQPNPSPPAAQNPYPYVPTAEEPVEPAPAIEEVTPSDSQEAEDNEYKAPNPPKLAAPTESKTITNLDILVSGDAPFSMYLSLGALLTLTTIYAARHAKAIYQVVKHGEHYIHGHPLLEASIVYAALWLLLVGTYGVIQ